LTKFQFDDEGNGLGVLIVVLIFIVVWGTVELIRIFAP